jgi:hypothetical protein
MSQQFPTKNKIRLYLFYFNRIDKPIKILASSKNHARSSLNLMIPNLPEEYRRSVVIDEKVESLVHGATSIILSGIKHLWHRERGWVKAKDQSK